MHGSTRARALRRSQTDAERLLWFHLRDRRLNGHKFKRQVMMGPYIADFVSVSAGLVIEVDGGQHAEARRYDAARDRFIRELGYEVLRFWNNDVLCNLEGVLASVLQVIEQRMVR